MSLMPQAKIELIIQNSLNAQGLPLPFPTTHCLLYPLFWFCSQLHPPHILPHLNLSHLQFLLPPPSSMYIPLFSPPSLLLCPLSWIRLCLLVDQVPQSLPWGLGPLPSDKRQNQKVLACITLIGYAPNKNNYQELQRSLGLMPLAAPSSNRLLCSKSIQI